MKTITFDINMAEALEAAVCDVFACSVYEIVGMRYTLSKKVVVFILNDLFGYNHRIIGRKYQLSHLYVPTIVNQIAYQFKVDLGFKAKVNEVKKRIGYEGVLDNRTA